MIGVSDLKELLEKYDINYKKVIDSNINIISHGIISVSYSDVVDRINILKEQNIPIIIKDKDGSNKFNSIISLSSMRFNERINSKLSLKRKK